VARMTEETRCSNEGASQAWNVRRERRASEATPSDHAGSPNVGGTVLRVLHVIPSVSKVHGGPSRAIELIEIASTAQGIAVVTATTDDDGPRARLSDHARAAHHQGAKRLYFRKTTDFYKVSIGFLRWIVRDVGDYDVVHIHALFSFTSVAAAWAARRAGVPYIIRPLGVLTHYGVQQRRPLLKRLSLALIEKPLLKGAAAVHFTSHAERLEAESLGVMMRSEVIPLAVRPAVAGDASRCLATAGIPNDGFRLLYLSRIDPKKNLESLLEAVVLLHAFDKNVRLLVAGRGEPGYEDRLKAACNAKGIGGHVHWLGHVSGEMQRDALAAADLFVLPSYSENFGIAVVEALSAGIPCVLGKGVAISGEIEATGAGLAVEPLPSNVAAAIRLLLTSSDRRQQASLAAVKMAEREFSLTAMGERLAALYSRLHANAGVRS
jgi:glycosyltransferase involved in cell wall biosynthesis